MWRLAASSALRTLSAAGSAVDAAPRALAASAAACFQPSQGLAPAACDAQQQTGAVSHPSTSHPRLCVPSPALPSIAALRSGQIGFRHSSGDATAEKSGAKARTPRARTSPFTMFCYDKVRYWESIEQDTSNIHARRAEEYNAIREQNPSFSYKDILQQMRTWQGDEAALANVLETGSGKGPYIPQNIATTQPVTPFDMYMLTTGHQWAHAPEAEKDRYYKQAALLDSALPVKREREAAVKPVAQTGDQHARKSIQNTAGASPQAPERKVKRGFCAICGRQMNHWTKACPMRRSAADNTSSVYNADIRKAVQSAPDTYVDSNGRLIQSAWEALGPAAVFAPKNTDAPAEQKSG